MLSGAGRRLWLPSLLVVLTAMTTGPGSALASTPPVELLDHTRLTYDVDDLRGPKSGIPFELHNRTDKPLDVTVRVRGLDRGSDNAVLQGLFDRDGIPAVVPAKGDASGSVPVVGARNPKVGSYAGSLVVVPAETGAVDRRPLTLTVAPLPPAAVSGAKLDPAGLPDVTLRATNFLPSPLAAVGPTLLAVAVIAALVLLLWPGLGLESRFLGILVAVVLGAWAVINLEAVDEPGGGTRDSRPGERIIRAESLPVSGNAAKDHVGVVLDDDGDVAELVVSGGRLRAKALEHAGAHSGQVDLNGPAAAGSAKATVNVRDWWPWALLAISLGVLAGLPIRRWFDRGRGRARLRLRANELFARVRDGLGGSEARPNWVPTRRMKARIDAILNRLRDDDTPDAAEEALKKAETYLQASEALRNRVDQLEGLAQAYRAAHSARSLGVDAAQVPALGKAEAVIALAFDSPQEDNDDKLLKDAETAVDSALTQVKTGLDCFQRTLAFVDAVGRAAEDAQDKGVKDRLEGIKADLEQCARQVLRAREADDASKAYATAVGKLPPEVTSMPEAASIGDGPGGSVPRVEHEIIAPGIDPAAAGNVDDLFAFRAIVAESSTGEGGVTWDFGDDTRVEQPIPPSGEGLWIQHRYAAGGSYTVTIDGADDAPLASASLEVTGPSRLDAEREALRARERAFTRIAVALTVASGMLALYVTNFAWGTNADYVKALLWGAIVPEGVALLGALVANTFPGGK